MIYKLPIRVYYEDTDMAGIVYYANYLRFIERGRSEWVREIGLDQNVMKERDGVVFVVRRVEADYLASARLDDELIVETEVKSVSGVRMVMEQWVRRGEEEIFHALVTVVCMSLEGQPVRLPANIRQMVH